MANLGIFGIGQLGRQLALAFIAVALAAILINTALSEIGVGSDISRLAQQQEASLTTAAALSAGVEYKEVGWGRADLGLVLNIVHSAGAAVQVRDNAGHVIGSSPHFGAMPDAGQVSEAVIVDGKQVGAVTVKFSPSGLGGLASNFEASQWRSRMAAAGIAALLALVVSIEVLRRITRPLDQMLTTARARGGGDRSARVDPVTGIGVVRELVEAFNQSIDFTDQQDRVRRNLVANVAHELRTPVAILQAGHEAMADGVIAPTSENLGSLRDEVLRLARMVADLESLAAAEAAALQLTLVPHDLAGIAEEAAAMLDDSFERKGVQLTKQLTAVRVACDKTRMVQVVTNLLTNALKFTPQGGRVTLETEIARGDRTARLTVRDTGVGIPPDELPRVTERFFRGQYSQHMAAGSGIGLTIVSELVRAHHGHLRVASEPGEGTEVTVTLPLASGSRRA
jgi:two-component system, OmpR family, sensor histidine kinase BaeS